MALRKLRVALIQKSLVHQSVVLIESFDLMLVELLTIAACERIDIFKLDFQRLTDEILVGSIEMKNSLDSKL